MTFLDKSDSQVTNAQIEQMALELFQAHGVINYSFGFDRAIRRAGQCDYSKKRITLSKHFVATADLDQIRCCFTRLRTLWLGDLLVTEDFGSSKHLCLAIVTKNSMAL
jgi:hypothetical protein